MYKLIQTEFPFTEIKNRKKRPGLLLTAAYGRHNIVLVAYVTSRKGEGLPTEVEIKKTLDNGLSKDSIIKLHKTSNLPESAIVGVLGEVSANVEKEIKSKLRKLFQI